MMTSLANVPRGLRCFLAAFSAAARWSSLMRIWSGFNCCRFGSAGRPTFLDFFMDFCITGIDSFRITDIMYL